MANCVIYHGGSAIESTQTTPVSVVYGGQTIASISSGEKILACNGKLMCGDVLVGDKRLLCSGKWMADDVRVVVSAGTYQWKRYGVETIRNVTATRTKSNVSQSVRVGGTYSCFFTSPENIAEIVADDGLIHWNQSKKWDNGNSLPASYAYAATANGIIFNSSTKLDQTEYYARITSRSVFTSTTFKLDIYKIAVSTTETMGSYIDTVQSVNQNAYPANGEQGGYWYVRV